MAAEKKDILSLIEADHRKVEELFAELESSDGKEAISLFNEIFKSLELHARSEELVFYPAMREYDGLENLIAEAESEHTAAKILLEQMKSFNPNDDEFQVKLGHLKESVMHHVQEEESEIFDAVRECMNEDELMSLGEEFQAVQPKIIDDVEALLTM